MEPLSSYYFSEGKFKLRSKWPKRIRVLISTVFLFFSAFFVTNEALTFQPTYASVKRDRINVISALPNVSMRDAAQIIDSSYRWAKEFNVDEKLILAIAKVESQFNKHAISSSGAYGIMQVIPVWHKDKIVVAKQKLGNPEIFNIDTNIFVGTWVLRDCLNKHTTINKALLCYSGQTSQYDVKVMQEYKKL